MRLFLLPKTFNNETSITLTGKDYNYIVNVLRLKKGQQISARDRNGNTYTLEILQSTGSSCTLSCQKSEKAEEFTDTLPQDRPQVPIVLYQCLPKGRKTDEIIKRATEIGVQRIVLVKSKNCVSDYSGKEESKLSRYDSIITEAVQQSGSTVPTQAEGVIDISKVPEHFEQFCRSNNTQGLGLLFHQAKLKEDQLSLVKTLKGFNGSIAIVIGSEGGFTENECRDLLDKGFKSVLLKTNILRCETASIYAMSAVQTLVEEGC